MSSPIKAKRSKSGLRKLAHREHFSRRHNEVASLR